MSILDEFDDGMRREESGDFRLLGRRLNRVMKCTAITEAGKPCRKPGRIIFDKRAYCCWHAPREVR